METVKSFKCPSCGQTIDYVEYIERGTRGLDGKGRFDDAGAEFEGIHIQCPVCKAPLETDFDFDGKCFITGAEKRS